MDPFRREKTVAVDLAELDTAAAYKILIGSVVPRPIAWVSTANSEGQVNLAPFSFFAGVSSRPPCVMFSIAARPDGSEKDTLRNLRETGELVIHSVPEWLAIPMNQTSAEYPYGVSELAEAGLTALASEKVRPPRVAEAPIQLECRVEKLVPIGDGGVGSAVVVIARIVFAHFWESAYCDGKVLLSAIRPLSRLGGAAYGKTPESFDLPRPEKPPRK
jgi:flavin reductase (DIM6/NTAB) family NADH-FMN oxidoreductase RutF